MVQPTAIASAESLGIARLDVAGATEIAPSAVATAEAFGTAVVDALTTQDLAPSAIATVEAFGVALLDVAGVTEIAPSAIATAEAIGAAALTLQAVTTTGVPIKVAVYEYLLSDAELVALIDDRLYPNAAPHGLGVYPYVTYRRMEYRSEHHLGGASGLARAEIRFEIRSASSMETGTIGERLRRLLDSLYATIGTTVDVFVQRCHLFDAEDDFVEPTDDGEIGQHRSRLDFEFFFKESLPAPLVSAR